MNDNSFNRGGGLAAPVFEDECMVGGNATILPGVRIGHKARVAAGATVTKSVKDGQTVWGVPAKPKERHPAWSVSDLDTYTGAFSSPSISTAISATKDWTEELINEAKFDG
jgi:acetyltransferase-like isoleucine patch superfamily enzyme